MGSKMPVRDETPSWVAMLPREVEKKVVELAKDGVQPALIGLRLRDSFGVPSVHEVTGKKVEQILQENKLVPKVPYDLANLIRRAISLQEHLQQHRKDLHNRRGLELIEARIRSLAKFHMAQGSLPEGWKYTRDGARLLVD
jgi:small subunit ribosomal protein S15